MDDLLLLTSKYRQGSALITEEEAKRYKDTFSEGSWYEELPWLRPTDIIHRNQWRPIPDVYTPARAQLWLEAFNLDTPLKMQDAITQALQALGGKASQGALLRYINTHYIVDPHTLTKDVHTALQDGLAAGRWTKASGVFQLKA